MLEGHDWRKVRNFSVSSLRDLGFGKTPKMEDHIQVTAMWTSDSISPLHSRQCMLYQWRWFTLFIVFQTEVRDFVQVLEKSGGTPFNFQPTLVSSVSNNIATLIFGERLPYDHPKRKVLSDCLITLVKNSQRLLVLSLSTVLFNFCRLLGNSSILEFERNIVCLNKFIKWIKSLRTVFLHKTFLRVSKLFLWLFTAQRRRIIARTSRQERTRRTSWTFSSKNKRQTRSTQVWFPLIVP